MEREGEEEEKGRSSKDKEVNKEGRRLVEVIRKRDWFILNGYIKGDEEGEWTYTGARGESVIDYIKVEEDIKEEVNRMEIGDRIDSDDHPVVIWLEGGGKEEWSGREGRGEVVEKFGTRRERKSLYRECGKSRNDKRRVTARDGRVGEKNKRVFQKVR